MSVNPKIIVMLRRQSPIIIKLEVMKLKKWISVFVMVTKYSFDNT